MHDNFHLPRQCWPDSHMMRLHHLLVALTSSPPPSHVPPCPPLITTPFLPLASGRSPPPLSPLVELLYSPVTRSGPIRSTVSTSDDLFQSWSRDFGDRSTVLPCLLSRLSLVPFSCCIFQFSRGAKGCLQWCRSLSPPPREKQQTEAQMHQEGNKGFGLLCSGASSLSSSYFIQPSPSFRVETDSPA